mgnify:CR=1 FL=1
MKEHGWVTHMEWLVVFLTIIGGFYMIEMRMDQFLMAWHQENKDFHGRLCAIEERNRGNH